MLLFSSQLNPPLTDWHGRLAWILGASSGIGRATAEALHKQGARVIVSARQSAALQDFVREHPDCLALPLDVTDAEALGLFWTDPYGFTPPQGEPVLAFSARVLSAVSRLQQQFAGERVLVVCHGGVMKLLLARARGLPREHLLQVQVVNGALFGLRVAAHGVLSEEG